jgi:hypothetical protein
MGKKKNKKDEPLRVKADDGLPHVPESDTSSEAAESMKPTVDMLRRQVYECIHDAHMEGHTCDEVEIKLKLTHQSVSARVNELRDAGVIVDIGERRKTQHKRKATVYVATKFMTPAMIEKCPVIRPKSWRRTSMGDILDIIGDDGFIVEQVDVGVAGGWEVTIRGEVMKCDNFMQVLQTIGTIVSKVRVDTILQNILANCGDGQEKIEV